MASTLLQVLRFSKSELEFLMAYLQEEYVKAHAKLREVRGVRSSVQRITSMLGRVSNHEQNSLKELLKSYPSLERLGQSVNQTGDEITRTRQLLNKVRHAHQNAAVQSIAQADGDYWSMITYLYGAVILTKLRPWINDEVVVELDENLHIYWGGRGHPLGPGHGHCVFSQQQLLFRRNPQ